MSRDLKHVPIWPMLLLFIVFPYFRHSLPEGEPKEELRSVYLVRAATEHFNLRINEVIKDHGDLPGKLQVENDSFAPGAPGVALLSVPAVLFAKACARVFSFELSDARLLRYLRVVVSIIPTCIVLLLLLVFLVRRGVHAHAARFALLATALSAPFWVATTSLSAAHLSALCLVSALMLIGDDEDWPSQTSFVLAGLLAAFAVLTCYPVLPIALMLLVYAFSRARSPQRVLGYLTPVVLAVAAMCVYHYMTTQTIFTVIEGTASDGSQQTSFWGVHAPKLQPLPRLFFGKLGIWRWAPVMALVPIGLLVMISRGEVGEATLLGAGMLWIALCASGMAQHGDAGVGAPLLPLAMVFGCWPLARAVEALSGIAGGSLVAGVLACWSALQAAALVSTHVLVPATYQNPLRDLSFAMLRDGIYAQSLGNGIGLHGDAAVAPVALMILAIACALSLGGAPREEGSGWRRVLAGIVFGSALFIWQLAWSRESHRRERYLETLAIERTLETTRTMPDARVVRRAASITASAPGSFEAKLARGHAATAFGDNASALEQYR